MLRRICIAVALVAIPSMGYAQTPDADQAELNQIEAEIESRSDKSMGIAPQSELSQPEAGEPLNKVSDLSRLEPFDNIAVLQRRFLPKTSRFQFFLGLTSIMNDPWFQTLGISGGFGYAFTESWAVQLAGTALSRYHRDSIKDLYNEHGVETSSIVSAKGYVGADVVWTPVYGKMSFTDDRIVPFDMYFSLGGGSTSLENGSGGGTVRAATGQIYAISKGTAVRWDLSWNSLRAKPTAIQDSQEQSFNNILLSVGFSFFFPEAGYR